MRLISTADLTLHTFPDDAIPRYSILSHTWGDNEVLFHEMLNPTNEIRDRAGYKKIQKCAEISREVWDCDFTWVDTCCIDKTSSSELSESINSMYAWYRDSHICFAYLEDFHGEHIDQLTQHERWFTRGWTLQEFIAPEEVIFFSASWKRVGNKQWHLPILESITGIEESTLRTNNLQDVSVAEKMKWIATRQTTKKEDLSYCMLGIFDVNMPLLYGEGEKAFTRLQEEIMRNSDDVTIFLWKSLNENPSAYRGALARHPIEFSLSTAPKAPMHVLDEPYRMTNKGLQMTMSLTELGRVASEHVVFLAKDSDCKSLSLLSFDQRDTPQSVVTHHIVLRKIKKANHHYVRAYPGFQFIAPRKAANMRFQTVQSREENIMVVTRLSLSDVDWVLPCGGFKIAEITYSNCALFPNTTGPVRRLASEFESELVKTTSSADNGVIEALYHSRYIGRDTKFPTPSSQHILLRYEQQHGMVHLFIFYSLREWLVRIDNTISIDALLRTAESPSSRAFFQGLFKGTADMRRKPEIKAETRYGQSVATFSWKISDDSLFLNVHINYQVNLKLSLTDTEKYG